MKIPEGKTLFVCFDNPLTKTQSERVRDYILKEEKVIIINGSIPTLYLVDVNKIEVVE